MRRVATCILALALVVCAGGAYAVEYKIGFVNTERLFREAAPAKRAQQKLEKEFANRDAELQKLAKKDVKAMMEALAEVGYKELKKNGVFVVPGFAKFIVVKKPATPAREGTNPFTGEKMMFKAKPARKIVRARPVKAAKMAV